MSTIVRFRTRSDFVGVALGCLLLWGCDEDSSATDAGMDAGNITSDGGEEGDAEADAAEPTPDGGEVDGGAEATTFERAVEAMGGESALLGLQQFQIEVTGNRSVDYEAPRPDGVMEVSTYIASYAFDLEADSLRVDATRTPRFEAFEFAPPDSYSLVLNGDVGALSAQVGFSPPGNLGSQSVAALRRQQRLFNPLVYLREGLSDSSLVIDGGAAMFHGQPHQIIEFDGEVSSLRLFVDDVSGLISKLETVENSVLARDVEIEVRYNDWQNRAGLMFPNDIELYTHGLLVQEERRSAVNVDPDLASDHFDLPETADNPTLDTSAFEFGQHNHQVIEAFFHLGFGYNEAPMLNSSELAPGLTLISNSAANTLAIAYDDGLVVVEAPGSPQHGNNLIDALATAFPGRTITHVIQSHHHQDHAAGVRSFVATGATAVVGNGVADFWEEVLSAPSTIRPDALSNATVTPTIEEVPLDGTFVLDDGTVKITAQHVSANPHSDDMLLVLVELGGEMYVFEADLYNAGFGFTLVVGGPESLFANLRDLGIIDASCASSMPLTIIPAHGVPSSLADSLAELASTGVDVSCPMTARTPASRRWNPRFAPRTPRAWRRLSPRSPAERM